MTFLSQMFPGRLISRSDDNPSPACSTNLTAANIFPVRVPCYSPPPHTRTEISP